MNSSKKSFSQPSSLQIQPTQPTLKKERSSVSPIRRSIVQPTVQGNGVNSRPASGGNSPYDRPSRTSTTSSKNSNQSDNDNESNKSYVSKYLFETQQIEKWTRNGQLNPGEVKVKIGDFVDGEMKEKLIWIFGVEIYNDALRVAKNAIANS
ncbi:hypothetical protein HK099_005232 [Clydaea vesicula]|uniref:Uncharacterized protein n=1 Tax=Clydaea vesicula TaxID=447962 RepID=A0AAD5Y203_9FUNG|nr:hypothetical protein HK099_005232 [Clydaea vesicula]